MYRESDRDGMKEEVNSLGDDTRDGPIVTTREIRSGNTNDPSESSHGRRPERKRRRRRSICLSRGVGTELEEKGL